MRQWLSLPAQLEPWEALDLMSLVPYWSEQGKKKKKKQPVCYTFSFRNIQERSHETVRNQNSSLGTLNETKNDYHVEMLETAVQKKKKKKNCEKA